MEQKHSILTLQWGTMDGFVLFVDSIAACSAPFMKAEVPVSRFASLNALLCCKLEIAFDRTRDCSRLW
jgi:hypothetical protein